MSINKSSKTNKKASSTDENDKMQSTIEQLQVEVAELKKENEILKLSSPHQLVDECNICAIDHVPYLEFHANLIYNSTSDIIFLMSVEPDGVFRCLSVNQAYLKSTGFSADQLIGKRVEEVVHVDGAEFIIKKYREAIQIGHAIQYEETHDFPSGVITVETTLTPIFNDAGICTYLRGVARDITERKKAEEVHRQWLNEMTNAHHFEKTKQEALRAFHEIQIKLSRVHVLDDFCRMAIELGKSELKFDRISLWFKGDAENVIIGSYGIDEHGNLRNEKDKKIIVNQESNFGHILSNKARVLMVHDTDLRDQNADVVGKGTQIIAALWDGDNIIGCLSADNLLRNHEIKQQDAELFELYSTIIGHLYRQKCAEEALRKNEASQRAMIANISDVIEIIGEDGRNIYISPNIEKWFGWKPEEFVGQNTWENIHIDDREYTRFLFEKLFSQSGTAITKECRFRCKDGSYKWIEYTATNLLHDADIGGILINYHDISERKQAANALADEKERLHVTLQSIGDGVISTDINAKIITINANAEKMTGYQQSEALGQSLSDIFQLIHQDTGKPYDDLSSLILINGETVDIREYALLINKNGDERVIVSHGTPIRNQMGSIIGAVLVFRDVTTEIQIQQDIQRMSKLDSLGVMAGGIAHDFNNLLTAIAGNIGLAQWMFESKSGEDAIQCLKDAEDASIRARDLTQQLLTFAKGGAPVRDNIAIEPIIREAVSLALTGSRNRCIINTPDSLWKINADAGQLNQVFHNLLINADQSMPEGGVINIIASNTYIPTDQSLKSINGQFVRIDVIDTGGVIPIDIQEKIFVL